MKKIGIIIFVVCMVVVMIAGCGSMRNQWKGNLMETGAVFESLGVNHAESDESLQVKKSEDQESLYENANWILYKQTIADYDKMMQDGQSPSHEKFEKSDGGKGRCTYYTIVDIDGNGVDELILRFDVQNDSHMTNQNTGYGESTFIYTIRDGKVIEVLTPKSGFGLPIRGFVSDLWHIGFTHIFKGSNLISRGMHIKTQKDAFYRYQDGILSETPLLEISRGGDEWCINNEYHSPEECFEAYNNASNNDKGYELQLYQRKMVKQEQGIGIPDLIEKYKRFIQSQTDGLNYLIYDID